jgi:NAD(P)-dependent dehydrogenase (short-subunit alcohol dehydrogenase family)
MTVTEAVMTQGHVGRGRLQNKVVLVFGAGCVGPGWGNGNSAAVAFAREGASVIAVDRDPKAADATRDVILSEGGHCHSMAADVVQQVDVGSSVADTVDRYGRIDVLHNNVGLSIMGGPGELSGLGQGPRYQF